MSRKPIIAGNWKMNKTVAQTEAMISELLPLVEGSESEVVVCVPYTDIAMASKMCKGSNVKVGAQNVAWADSGAFTGEVSAEMLCELGTEYVIIGHSERRQFFGETNSSVNARTVAALKSGLKPIVCVGELLDERQGGLTEKVLGNQIAEGLAGFTDSDYDSIAVAYEPVWAIGTGLAATTEQAQETVAFVRSEIEKIAGKANADKVRILYGGSMNAGNAKLLMAEKDIDGGLIGGASLKPQDFTKVVKYYLN